MYACMYACVYVCMYVCVCMYAWCRPLPGYWTDDESQPDVQACSYQADSRCAGRNTTISTAACGVGYIGISSGCAQQYYSELGACVACPPGKSSKAVVIGFFVLGSLLAFLVLFGVVFLIQRAAGKASVGTALFRALDLVMWVLVTWQTIIQVGKRMSLRPMSHGVCLLCYRFYSWTPQLCCIRSATLAIRSAHS
jgi:hypothetical protein